MTRSARPLAEAKLAAEARAAIEACAVGNARLAARRLTQFLIDRMKASRLGVAQFGLMAQIAAARDDSLGALAERSGLDPSTLSRNLQVLEREGLVEMTAGGADSRRRAVRLTEEGAPTGERRMPSSPPSSMSTQYGGSQRRRSDWRKRSSERHLSVPVKG
jgi:DNA-binding MarR family transcriptional regulator